MFKLKLNLNIDPTKVKARLSRAFDQTSAELDTELQLAFDDPIWSWAGLTKRRNGEIVGSPRNIVDLGKLRGSQSRERVNDFTARYTWSAEYAAAVFVGAETKNGTLIPARNLPRYVVFNSSFSFLEEFATRARAALN